MPRLKVGLDRINHAAFVDGQCAIRVAQRAKPQKLLQWKRKWNIQEEKTKLGGTTVEKQKKQKNVLKKEKKAAGDDNSK